MSYLFSPCFRDKDIRRDVQRRFSTTYSAQLSLKFIHLDPYARLLLPSPRLSLLVESFQTMRLAFIALSMSSSMGHLPDVFVDTTGCAFTYLPAALLFGCRVVAYVHYPTISTDMLQLVWQRRRTAYTLLPSGETTEETPASSPSSAATTTKEATNDETKSRLGFVTAYAKLVYYVMFAVMYGLVGSLASLVMVNSTWTYHHIRSLWRVAAWLDKIHIVFPPCQVPENGGKQQQEPLTTTREPIILSIGQFRPEKDHALQLEAMALLLKHHPELKRKPNQPSGSSSSFSGSGALLVLAGSCRNNADQNRLKSLILQAGQLNLNESVRFVVNEPYSVIQEWLNKSSVGVHTVRAYAKFGWNDFLVVR